jgi:cytochrome c-type biogenesis protein CcmH/NrfG
MVGGGSIPRWIWQTAILAAVLCAASAAYPQASAQDWLDKGNALRQSNGEYQPPDLAAYYFSKAVEKSPNDANALATLGQVYLQLQQYADALKAVERAIRLEPRRSSHYLLRADIYRGMNQRKDECTDVRKACELGDQNACGQVKARC